MSKEQPGSQSGVADPYAMDRVCSTCGAPPDVECKVGCAIAEPTPAPPENVCDHVRFDEQSPCISCGAPPEAGDYCSLCGETGINPQTLHHCPNTCPRCTKPGVGGPGHSVRTCHGGYTGCTCECHTREMEHKPAPPVDADEEAVRHGLTSDPNIEPQSIKRGEAAFDRLMARLKTQKCIILNSTSKERAERAEERVGEYLARAEAAESALEKQIRLQPVARDHTVVTQSVFNGFMVRIDNLVNERAAAIREQQAAEAKLVEAQARVKELEEARVRDTLDAAWDAATARSTERKLQRLRDFVYAKEHAGNCASLAPRGHNQSRLSCSCGLDKLREILDD